MATEISTLPANINYTLVKGDTWLPGTITADINGTPINFTGYSAKLEIRPNLSGSPTKTLTSPSSGITLSSSGVITLSMTAAETNAIPVGEYKYDLQITSGAGAVRTYSYGTITIVTDVTAN